MIKYSRIYNPILISYFFLFIIFLFNINFNINNFENINHLFNYLNTYINPIYTILFVSIAFLCIGSLTYLLYKYLNLLFFSVLSAIIILPVFFIFIYLKSYVKDFNLFNLIQYFLINYIVFCSYELINRYYIINKARGIFFGTELLNLSKQFLVDKNTKDDFTAVYLYIPYFYEIIYKINSIKEIKNYINKVEAIIFKILNKYNVILTNNNFNSYTYLIKKQLIYKNQDHAYQAVLSALEILNIFNNLNVDNYLLKELKPKFIICSAISSKAFYDIKNKKYFLISDVFVSINKLSNNFKDDNIVIDETTNKLISNYFTTKELQHNIHAVLGISTY